MPRNPNQSTSAVCLLDIATKHEDFSESQRNLVATFFLRAALVCLLFLFISHDSFLTKVRAHGATATLSGTVKDETGAVVPGASVAVISVTQGFQRSAVSNSEGARSEERRVGRECRSRWSPY